MIAQYYYEEIWIQGMPLFHQLPESHVKKIKNLMSYAVWNLDKALGEFWNEAFKKNGNYILIAPKINKKNEK